ncbi:MAG: hypothetical protein AB7I50_22775 [Vicinamibacterales bacterium]
MAELTRQPSGEGATPDEHRERTIETLLITGLDLYFAGEYERAIHAWTRVLFLDRSHARARAYIDRARAVMAERQRETDELLHRGLAALDAGETRDARLLLASAIERGGVIEEAEVALERLGRLDLAESDAANAVSATDSFDSPAATPAARGRRWVPFVMATAAVPLLLVAGALASGWNPWAISLSVPGSTPVLTRPADEPLPAFAPADLALRRARALFARGHLREALAELTAIRPDDARYGEARQFQAQVQRTLLDAADVAPSEAEGFAANRP